MTERAHTHKDKIVYKDTERDEINKGWLSTQELATLRYIVTQLDDQKDSRREQFLQDDGSCGIGV